MEDGNKGHFKPNPPDNAIILERAEKQLAQAPPDDKEKSQTAAKQTPTTVVNDGKGYSDNDPQNDESSLPGETGFNPFLLQEQLEVRHDLNNSTSSVSNPPPTNEDLLERQLGPPPTTFALLIIVLSVCLYLFDHGSDIWVAYHHYQNSDIGYFVLTLAFLITPGVIVGIWNLRLVRPFKISRGHGICLLLLLDPVRRDIISLKHGIIRRREGTCKDFRYYESMRSERYNLTVNSIQKLFHSFLENAPQVTLQLYIFIRQSLSGTNINGDNTTQLISIGSSLVGLAFSVTSHKRSQRKGSYTGSFVVFLWHLFYISARIFALSTFCAFWPVLFIIFCGCHWTGSVIALFFVDQHPRRYRWDHQLIMISRGLIFIYVLIDKETSCNKYLTFYTIVFVENTIFLLACFFSRDDASLFLVYGIVAHYVSFFVGILFMAIYYIFLHSRKFAKVFTQTVTN